MTPDIDDLDFESAEAVVEYAKDTLQTPKTLYTVLVILAQCIDAIAVQEAETQERIQQLETKPDED